MAGAMALVVFEVECSETRPGEVVFAVGSHDALGAWSLAMAVPLSTTAERFPMWSSGTVSMPAGQAVDFKFVVQAEDRTGKPHWEEGGLQGNRTIVPEVNLKMTLRTSWGRPATETSSVPIEASAPGKSLATRDSMRRNFSQSLFDASGDIPTGPEAAPVRGVPLKRINSLSALSIMADSEEKGQARTVGRKAQPLYEPHNLNVPVVVVTSEFSPWSKTGGLGLVAASYSYEFPRSGHRTMVVSPKYKHYNDLHYVGETKVVVNGQEEVVKYMHHWMEVVDGRGCDCIFVEHPALLKDGGLYNDDGGREYPDNLFRFTLLSLAAMEAPLILKLGGCAYGDKVVFLANDWQSGLVPLYMYYKYRPHGTYSQARVIYIVHNLGYQGQYHCYDACHFFGISQQAVDDIALGDSLNLSKGALICADRVITVSPNYADEIQTPEGGFSLQDFVRAKAHALRLAGILNGIDDCWNPQTDKHIAFNYSVENFEEGKAKNKAELQKQLGLMEDPHCVLIGFVGRLTWQKGVDVIGSSISWLMADTGNGVTGHAQLIMMGNGQREYADTLRWAEGNFRGRVCGYVGFDPKVEHQIMAGCDLLLMPSRYEPCGLPQMYSQQYGTLPIVTATGGLKDTVKDLSKGPAEATGFQISHLNPDKLKEVIYRAAELILRRPAEFRCMQRTAMRTDFYWRRAIDEYERHIDFTLYDPPATR